jgi:hypothetical protein
MCLLRLVSCPGSHDFKQQQQQQQQQRPCGDVRWYAVAAHGLAVCYKRCSIELAMNCVWLLTKSRTVASRLHLLQVLV